MKWEHWRVLGAIRTRAERRIFPASGHTLHAPLSLSLSLIVSHTDSVATGLLFGLTINCPEECKANGNNPSKETQFRRTRF